MVGSIDVEGMRKSVNPRSLSRGSYEGVPNGLTKYRIVANSHIVPRTVIVRRIEVRGVIRDTYRSGTGHKRQLSVSVWLQLSSCLMISAHPLT